MHRIKKHLVRCISILHIFFTYHYAFSEESVLISSQEFISLAHEQEKDAFYCNTATQEELVQLRAVNPKKPLTLIVYIAADNDLHPFA